MIILGGVSKYKADKRLVEMKFFGFKKVRKSKVK